MRIAATYSHLHGLEYLLVRKKKLWTEIKTVIDSVDADACRVQASPLFRKELQYSPKEMNCRFEKLLAARKWEDDVLCSGTTSEKSNRVTQKQKHKSRMERLEIERVDLTAGRSGDRFNFFKDRVAIDLRLSLPRDNGCDLFVKHLAFYVRDQIDVGVEILPMKALQQHMSSGPGYYEGELYNVIRNGRGVPAVPLVVVGIAP